MARKFIKLEDLLAEHGDGSHRHFLLEYLHGYAPPVVLIGTAFYATPYVDQLDARDWLDGYGWTARAAAYASLDELGVPTARVRK